MRFFIAQRPYVISFGWVSFLVGKPVVELRQVLLTLLFVFQVGMPIVPCSNSSSLCFLYYFSHVPSLNVTSQTKRAFLSQIYER